MWSYETTGHDTELSSQNAYPIEEPTLRTRNRNDIPEHQPEEIFNAQLRDKLKRWLENQKI